MKTFLSIALLFVVLTQTSCRKEINGSGRFITQTRNLTSFQGVETNGDFDVIIKESPLSKVVLYGEDNILPHINTIVSGNKLRIYYDDFRGRFDDNGVTITVFTPSVNSVSLSGSGRVTSDGTLNSPGINTNVSGSGSMELNLNSNDVASTLSGSGNITLHGVASTIDCVISGSGDINSFDLPVNDASVVISGSGNCYVNVSDHLEAHISGSGDVIYMGSPVIRSIISGSGRVKHY